MPRPDNTLMRAPVLFALMMVSCAAQDLALPLVNLGRLSITRVFGSEHGGAPDAEGFYGVRNAFDAGSNILNGIKYSRWNTGPGAFVIVRFSEPVTITGIVVEGSGSSWMPSPESFTVQIRSPGSQGLFLSPRIGLEGKNAVYATPGPVVGAREVMLTFRSKSAFAVEEIQILGPAPIGVDLTPVTPLRDSDVVLGSSSRSQANGSAQKGSDPGARGERDCENAHRTIGRGSFAESRPQGAGLVGAESDGGPVIRTAGPQQGIGINCQAGKRGGRHRRLVRARGPLVCARRRVRALSTDLARCPQADDAWWMRRFRACGDFEGSQEEYKGDNPVVLRVLKTVSEQQLACRGGPAGIAGCPTAVPNCEIQMRFQ
ncbi:MAG: hypothetical protein ACJ74Z_08540 [Bryobacteraceae bacterium]